MDIFTAPQAGTVPSDFMYGYLFFLLLISSIFDFRVQRIPNYLTLTSMVAGLAVFTIAAGVSGFVFSLAGLIAGFGLLIIPYALGGMGAGDVKLMASVGAFLGIKGVFVAFLFTALIGGVYAVLVILSHRKIFKNYFKDLWNTFIIFIILKKYIPDPIIEHKDKPRLCYGIAIALGTYTYMGLTISGYDFSF